MCISALFGDLLQLAASVNAIVSVCVCSRMRGNRRVTTASIVRAAVGRWVASCRQQAAAVCFSVGGCMQRLALLREREREREREKERERELLLFGFLLVDACQG